MSEKCDVFNCPHRADSGYCKSTACVNVGRLSYLYNSNKVDDIKIITEFKERLIKDIKELYLQPCGKIYEHTIIDTIMRCK